MLFIIFALGISAVIYYQFFRSNQQLPDHSSVSITTTTSPTLKPTKIQISPTIKSLNTYAFNRPYITPAFQISYPTWQTVINNQDSGVAEITITKDKNVIEIDLNGSDAKSYDHLIWATITNYGSYNILYDSEVYEEGKIKIIGASPLEYNIFNVTILNEKSYLAIVKISQVSESQGWLTIWDKSGEELSTAKEILNSIKLL